MVARADYHLLAGSARAVDDGHRLMLAGRGLPRCRSGLIFGRSGCCGTQLTRELRFGDHAGYRLAPEEMLVSLRRQLWQALLTGDQSRLLKIGDRVCWEHSATDLGTVVGVSWSGVTIDWDDGHTASIQHNDMAQVERVPTNII